MHIKLQLSYEQNERSRLNCLVMQMGMRNKWTRST